MIFLVPFFTRAGWTAVTRGVQSAHEIMPTVTVSRVLSITALAVVDVQAHARESPAWTWGGVGLQKTH